MSVTNNDYTCGLCNQAVEDSDDLLCEQCRSDGRQEPTEPDVPFYLPPEEVDAVPFELEGGMWLLFIEEHQAIETVGTDDVKGIATKTEVDLLEWC